ncbi:uncharacterized protein YggU (UPF0235/DUF167 family) [Microbacteriaceae bacterium SG_E_30_P1]|uniref:UPF0235 protein M2152_001196 n=1 Tax=Antiquaquibacter oligotrophicus TaxID=2880260 RepID=A0ABT6KPB3_9MICO|nr:DUF167 domain-containing protein [Antiquaquibacter oligotrophicus]MDH6181014.1 uncharacterized protein YggU (UPF0235/DUF167 family) [Antiquaquibacter oligotrophicus]MDH6181016.1 uncharacterized protein YggU (UPF0235/DUF167 family) [Antiquaquibacter oligotrophicus]UDF13285.1 DUF167 domain-containing protein [Antiquaquibacter oligotrophicus]UDF13287.1 DUF167 domain-containing protein [Antiquaquibacter oligotrophicus]
MLISVHVHPGSRRPGVGGEHAGALVVRVAERAVDGRATRAVEAALASAFGVRLSDVHLAHGARSREKRFEVIGASEARLTELLTA